MRADVTLNHFGYSSVSDRGRADRTSRKYDVRAHDQVSFALKVILLGEIDDFIIPTPKPLFKVCDLTASDVD